MPELGIHFRVPLVEVTPASLLDAKLPSRHNSRLGGKLMKHTLNFLLLAMAALTPAQTTKNASVQGADATTQALMNLENRWVGALMKSDAATLDFIFADTYVDTDEHSHRSDKQGVLSVLKSGELKIESIRLSDMRVYDYGDAAVVTGVPLRWESSKGSR